MLSARVTSEDLVSKKLLRERERRKMTEDGDEGEALCAYFNG